MCEQLKCILLFLHIYSDRFYVSFLKLGCPITEMISEDNKEFQNGGKNATDDHVKN